MNTNFKVFGLTRHGIEPKSTVQKVDALSTTPWVANLRLFAMFHAALKAKIIQSLEQGHVICDDQPADILSGIHSFFSCDVLM